MSCRRLVFWKFPIPKASTSCHSNGKNYQQCRKVKRRFGMPMIAHLPPCTRLRGITTTMQNKRIMSNGCHVIHVLYIYCIFMSTATSLPGALQTAKASLEPRTDFLDFARLANTSCEREGPSTSTWFKENTAQSSRIALCILGRAPCCFAEMKAFGLLTGANGAKFGTCFFPLAFRPRCNSGVVFVWLGTLEGSLRNNSTCLRNKQI